MDTSDISANPGEPAVSAVVPEPSAQSLQLSASPLSIPFADLLYSAFC